MTTQAQIDVSAIGNASRFNAVTHGLTAKTAVLPGEQAAEYQAVIDGIRPSLETRNALEDALAERAARACWQLDRANRAEIARITRDMLTRPAADALRAALEASALGNRLFHDRRGPIALYPGREHDFKEPRTSWSEDANDPDNPADLVRQLEATLDGCRWLLGRWSELRGVLDSGMGWQSHEKIKVIRLMGKQPLDAVGVREIAQVFLACHVIEPQFSYAFQELRCEVHEDQFKIHRVRLDRWKEQGLKPKNPAAARAGLLKIVDTATERLRALEAMHQNVADAVKALQPKILSHDDSKGGEQIRRHQGSCNRLYLRNLGAIHKARRDEATGWGRTRQERDRRKQDRGKTGPFDDRLVVDERGSVRPAEGYKGNLEEGLARYKAKFPSHSQREIEETYVRAVPDFARWTPPPVVETDGGAEETCARRHGGDPSGAGESRRTATVPLMLTETGERANLQNENVDDGLGTGDVSTSDEGGADDTCGRGDGGDPSDALDPCATETDGGVEETCARRDGGDPSGAGESRRTATVPLMLTETGERANLQNENVDDELGTGDVCTTIEGGAVETCGRGDGGDPLAVLDPRPTETDGGKRKGARFPHGTEGLPKHEKRRRRRELRELERSGEGAPEEDDVAFEALLDSIAERLPNVAGILRAHLARSP